MIFLSISQVLQHPNENGISIFTLGILFILTLYHFLLYFQHKDKAYLYYSLYTALIFLSHLPDTENSFIQELIPPSKLELLDSFNYYLVWTYNSVYFIFAITFLDLKYYSLKWYKIIFRSVYFLMIVTLAFELLYRITGNLQFLEKGNIFFLVFIIILGLISYVPLFKIKNQLKYYIIIGSLVLFITSLTAEFILRLKLVEEGNQISYSIFYFGIIIENMFFSLGLGRKQKLILQEKNDSQLKLIMQLQENEKLKKKNHDQLTKDVSTLSKQVEIDKLDAINAKYEKELAELKVTLLRSQMNPHFIFNSLNSIKLYIINNEKENAVYYLNKFSKLIRKILATTREKQITLAEEIETIELYLNIENIRFENQIKYSIALDKKLNVDTIKIPCLILQPFIENAIWHGLSSKKDKLLSITIKAEKQSFVKICIQDNGIGRQRSAEINEKKLLKKTSIGINLTKERLKLFYKDYSNKHSLKFADLFDKDKNPIGTRVDLVIPIK